ncbi:cytochrome P450 [Tropicibacter sp. Alg240-R139]|uniref:cytochrome P450 n=1 Tax=Tropicibacter sp. Alg240-R139 TaxID=2305991 RepID=UPI0013DF896D|nr:cytochrome P450 [Tropicibacter sp. Alg240-R139]
MADLIDLRSPRFAADKYGYIEELRQQSPIGRVEGGFVFFNQEDARYVLRCEDFRFDFFHADPSISPYLADSVQHEMLNMHGPGHELLKKIVMKALRDVTYKGIAIRKGDRALTLIPAANRDPEAFSDPNRFDITRPRQRHYSFGYGMHACPGAQLARMEMALAIEVLLARTQTLQLLDIPERDSVQKGGSPLRLQLALSKRV